MTARLILRWIVAGTFVYAGIVKLFSAGFGDTIFTRFATAIPFFATAFPIVEIALDVWILSNLSLNRAMLVAILMLFVFASLIATEMFKTAPKPCGCGASPFAPVLSTPVETRYSLATSLALDVLLIGACNAILLGEEEWPLTQRHISRRRRARTI